MTTSISISPVPLLPAEMILSTASTTVSTTTIVTPIQLPCGVTTHIQIMVAGPSSPPLSSTIEVNGSLNIAGGTTYTFPTITLTDVVWSQHDTLGQYTITTIELPEELAIPITESGSATLQLNHMCDSHPLNFVAVLKNGVPTHHHLLAGINTTTLAGVPPIPPTLSSLTTTQFGTQLQVIIPNDLTGQYILYVTFILKNRIAGRTYNEDIVVLSKRKYTMLQYSYSGDVLDTACAININGDYQTVQITMPYQTPNKADTTLIFEMITYLISGYSLLMQDTTNAFAMFTTTSTKTRPVGYCTADTPDYYDWGLGAYLGADFATGNCVTQRSSSSVCRSRSMCLENTCTVVGGNYACLESVDMTSTFSPVSPDMGFSAGVQYSTIPKPWPIGHGTEFSAVPPHLKTRSTLYGSSSCPCGTYYIPENTQPCGIAYSYDIYSVIPNGNDCTQHTSTYPLLGFGADGCSSDTAVCVPGTVPVALNSTPNNGLCQYVCIKNDSIGCTAYGFVYVDEIGACFREPPTKDDSLLELKSTDLCATSGTCEGGCQTCVPLSQAALQTANFNVTGNGWSNFNDFGGCTGGSCGLDPNSGTCNNAVKCGDPHSSPFTMPDTVTTIPCGYYYWNSNTKPYDIFNMYAQTPCVPAAGETTCTDVKTTYTLGWEGGWS